MGLISFIKNLFTQKEDDLWVEPNTNKKSFNTDAYVNRTLEVNPLSGEIIIKGKTIETYPVEYWFPR